MLDGFGDGPMVAYGADMDAVVATTDVLSFLRADGVFDGGFASRVPGVARLCGHDLHAVIGVGVARGLARGSGAILGRLVFVFQPPRSRCGVRAMLETGLV